MRTPFESISTKYLYSLRGEKDFASNSIMMKIFIKSVLIKVAGIV